VQRAFAALGLTNVASARGDLVTVNLADTTAGQVIRVHASFLPTPGYQDVPVAAVVSITMRLLEGDDQAMIAGNFAVPALLDGGDGNDHLFAGGGGSVLLGGRGNDFLQGGAGRDILIGGLGLDRLNGQAGEDILIGGTTAFDASEAALLALLQEWNSTRTLEERVANIRASNGPILLNTGYRLQKSETVFDDGDEDILNGAAAVDWLFFKEDEDKLMGQPELAN
jgi:Ca2+-binding RTX toxin-like protein